MELSGSNYFQGYQMYKKYLMPHYYFSSFSFSSYCLWYQPESPYRRLKHFFNIVAIAAFSTIQRNAEKKSAYLFTMATNTLKWPVTNTLFRNIKFIVRQGNLLWALPFSYKDERTPFIITHRSDLKFKFFMTFFTILVLTYSTNYIQITYWEARSETNRFVFRFAVTFVDVCIYILSLTIFLNSQHFCCMKNALAKHGREFNCECCK
jgi:hypothetical protein